MKYDKCDGYVAVLSCGKGKTAIVTMVTGSETCARALLNLRQRAEAARFETKVDMFDIVYEEGKVFIFAVIDMMLHTKKYLNDRLNELVGFIRRSRVIRDPIVCHIKVPIPSSAFA
jgi:hypothetical protein